MLVTGRMQMMADTPLQNIFFRVSKMQRSFGIPLLRCSK